MKSPKSGLPFLINAVPVQQENGPTMLELHQQSLGWMTPEQKSQVVCSDAYYLDTASRVWLRENGIKYLCSVNPVRFSEVWSMLKSKVKKKRQIAVAWNKDTEEAAVHMWLSGKKKAYILTNAFSYTKSKAKLDASVFQTPTLISLILRIG
jgi:hypothetical protein